MSRPLFLESASRSEVGKCRALNQDVCCLHPGLGVYLVGDGMGGHVAGELAAAIAAESIVRFFERCQTGWPDGLAPAPRNPERPPVVGAIEYANAAILRRAAEQPEKRGMGAAIAVVHVETTGLYVGHVGHVRAYRLRHQRLQRLTEDHTKLNDDLWRGVPFDVAERRPDSGALSRVLGWKNVDVAVHRSEAQPQDVLLLCSNGVYNTLSDLHIARILSGRSELQQIANALVDGALARGAADDVTCVLLRWAAEMAFGTAV